MKTRSILLASIASVAFSFTAGADAAVFAKYDGVDGESKNSAPKTIQSADTSRPAALLLPAVQAAREAARRSSSKKKGKVEATWKVEEGVK